MTLRDIIKAAKQGVLQSVIPFVDDGARAVAAQGRGDVDWQEEPTLWHPSSLAKSGFCPRLAIISRFFPSLFPPIKEEKPDLRRVRIFEYGRALHFWYQNVLLAKTLYGFWEDITSGEVRQGFRPEDPRSLPYLLSPWIYREPAVVNRALDLGGHIDGLHVSPKGLIGLEFKTSNAYAFGYAKNSPKDTYVVQTQLYMACDLSHVISFLTGKKYEFSRELFKEQTGQEYKKPDIFCILYLNKNDSTEAEHFIKYDEPLISDLLKSLASFKTSEKDKTLPNILSICKRANSAYRQNCPVEELCDRVGSGAKGFEAFAAMVGSKE